MEKAREALEKCPICGHELKDVIIELQYIPRRLFLRKAFCPECKIVRSSFFGIYAELSFPGVQCLPLYACADCGSVWFIQKVDPFLMEKEKKCWLCGGKVKGCTDNEFEQIGLKQPIGIKRSEQIIEWTHVLNSSPRPKEDLTPVVVIKNRPKGGS